MNVLLERPVAGAIAVRILVDVVGLRSVPRIGIVDPSVAVGAGVFGDQSCIGVQALLLIE